MPRGKIIIRKNAVADRAPIKRAAPKKPLAKRKSNKPKKKSKGLFGGLFSKKPLPAVKRADPKKNLKLVSKSSKKPVVGGQKLPRYQRMHTQLLDVMGVSNKKTHVADALGIALVRGSLDELQLRDWLEQYVTSEALSKENLITVVNGGKKVLTENGKMWHKLTVTQYYNRANKYADKLELENK
jgi:hypothetical protein